MKHWISSHPTDFGFRRVRYCFDFVVTKRLLSILQPTRINFSLDGRKFPEKLQQQLVDLFKQEFDCNFYKILMKNYRF